MRYFKGKQFKQDIILVAVGYYCRFSLSYRDVSEILKERGVSVPPTTIMRWVHEYGNLIYQIWKKKNKSGLHAWHLDETYIKVKGEWRYLYRAIDQEGHTLDIQFRKTSDQQATYMFMKRLTKDFGEPTALTTDKAPPLLCAFNKLKHKRFYVHTKHRTVKHLNNLIEQDHRHIKRRFVKSAGFQNLCHASRTINGIETIHALYKRNRGFSTYKELQKLLVNA
ncbi:IS6 family transposase [Bacillus wiedmannii]|uniref:IS6 family transposase n=1 Tax=Bacillus wiedmannii TaxID=1890302 RepID=UPI0011559F23|nr:IS6 family transposase [Bacillus wiedmannii]